MNTPKPPLIDALLKPSAWPHPVGEIRLIETHISWVLLTGQYAYKIKKPVDFGFLDFSTLERRQRFCNEELRLNRRLAPQLYLDVVTITGTPASPAINGAGPVIDYAVRMRQFNPAQQLDHLVTAGTTPDARVFDRLAARIVDFHDQAEVATETSPWGTPDAILQPVIDNFEQIAELPFTSAERDQLQALRRWSEHSHGELTPTLRQRRQAGRIRECHGDLHLANLALIDGEAVPFDCLEFSPELRWVDCASEIAFLVMDLDYHNEAATAHHFLNAWLHHGGDTAAVACLRYYLVYRAMVRAKVACLRARQSDDDAIHAPLLTQYRRHLELAHDYTRSPPRALIITHGLAGCGKTTVTDALLFPCRALRVRSDVERKRLHGLAPAARSGSGLDSGLYDVDSGRRTYDRLAEAASAIINGGWTAMIDATFLRREQRQRFRQLAGQLGVPLVILDIHADTAVLRERVAARERTGADASEAGLAVLDKQLDEREPLQTDECDAVVGIDTATDLHPADIVARIQALMIRAQ